MAILTHVEHLLQCGLVEVFPAVVGSYLNLTIAAWALVIIAVTRGRLGYRAQASPPPKDLPGSSFLLGTSH
jgi:hypothetical protein